MEGGGQSNRQMNGGQRMLPNPFLTQRSVRSTSVHKSTLSSHLSLGSETRLIARDLPSVDLH